MDSGNIWTSRDEGVVTQAERTVRVKETEASKQHVCWGNTKLPGLTGLECAWRAISSIQFSRSVVSDSLRPQEPQHARPPCLSPTAGVYPNTCPLSRWWHATISSSVVPFSSRLQSFPASGAFQMSQFFAGGGQNVGVSGFSISPSNEYSELISFRIDWLDLLAVPRTLKSLL